MKMFTEYYQGKLKELYHGTYSAYADDILTNGLMPQGFRGANFKQTTLGYVYLTDNIPLAQEWADSIYQVDCQEADDVPSHTGIVFAVDLTKLNLNLLEPDPNAPNHNWRYRGLVPPNAIRIIKNKFKLKNE
jgi:hypothetical protein